MFHSRNKNDEMKKSQSPAKKHAKMIIIIELDYHIFICKKEKLYLILLFFFHFKLARTQFQLA